MDLSLWRISSIPSPGPSPLRWPRWAAFPPAPDADSGRAYKAVYGVVKWIGCRFGKAKNSDGNPRA